MVIMLAWAAAAGCFLLGWFTHNALVTRRGYVEPYQHFYEGDHAWDEWSPPYKVNGDGPWQMRRCQCGNRDSRRAP